jgi:hypothetical protein
VKELWRYDAEKRGWVRESFKPVAKVTGAGVVADITDKVGLYWLKWPKTATDRRPGLLRPGAL